MKLLTALAATVAALTMSAAPAAAELTATQRRAMGADLARVGVEMIFTDHCPDGMAGVYNSKHMTMKVCSANIHTNAFLDEVVAHESVHVIQHCIASRMGVEGLLPIHTMVAQRNPEAAHKWLTWVNSASVGKAERVNSSSEFNGSGISVSLEREAYALEDEPAEVHGLLRSACLGED